MGDRYQSSHRHGGDRYDDRYDDHYDNRYGARYDERPPARDYHDSNGYYDQRPSGYTFRGAADRESYRPPPDFTFRAQGPPAPRFPPSDYYAPQSQPQSRSRRNVERTRDDRRPAQAGQRGESVRGRGRRGGFKTRAAHTRDILRTTRRETTPEQLEGMNSDGHTRFKEVESSGDEGGVDLIDLTRSSDEDGEIAAPRKRARLDAPSESAVPKWSNPDPYTVLPPPETLGAPKKDIVQVIRKAKVDAATAADAKNVAQEADFISLNFDDEPDDEDQDDEMDDQPPPNAPRGPASIAPVSFLPAKDPSFESPPPPPPGFVMPTRDELEPQMDNRGGPRKRKRERRPAKGAEGVLPEWQADYGNATPWYSADHLETSNNTSDETWIETARKGSSMLDQEIRDFYDFVRPYDYEEAVRRDLIERILQATKASPTPNARNVDIQCFGSFAAGLYLPTADMDLVAVTPDYLSRGRKSFCQHKKHMYNLAAHLEHVGIAPPRGVVVIHKAKVPIIKFVDKRTSIKVDISFENDSGLWANDTFKMWKDQFPDMPVIVVLVKQLLAMHGLNEVFSGGIGGFTIICLVVSMLQLMPSHQAGAFHPNSHYGDLLLYFLDLYGNRFDIRQTGIIMDPPGYFDKIAYPNANQHAERLTIMDPNRPDNDISGGSHKINDVLDCFRTAYTKIQRRLAKIYENDGDDESILNCILGGNYSSFIHQREKLDLLHNGYSTAPAPPPAPIPKTQPLAKQAKMANKSMPPPAPAPASNGQRVQHSLPAKPLGLNHVSGVQTNGRTPLGATETVQAPPKKQMNDTREGDPNRLLTRAQDAKKKGVKSRSERKGEDRARSFKQVHPEVPNVPDRMSSADFKRWTESVKITTRNESSRKKSKQEKRKKALKDTQQVPTQIQTTSAAVAQPGPVPKRVLRSNSGQTVSTQTKGPSRSVVKEDRKRIRAEKFKIQYPHIPQIPASLKHTVMLDLCKQHNINVREARKAVGD